MDYISTRGGAKATPSYAILKGIAPDGGLYVPREFPAVFDKLRDICAYDYQELAFEILSAFLTDFTEDELKRCIASAYTDTFDGDVAPLRKVGEDYFLELFHGRTAAFKDVALSILPYLTMTAAEKNGLREEPVILTATSGDTGKAALAAFADVPGTFIVVFFPEDGVSDVQKLQMQTQQGKNVLVVGIDGNFDHAQSGVKAIFGDEALNARLHKAGYALTSANSINIGRLLPQVVYYYYAYAQMLKTGGISAGEKLDFTVPTGNFGNILAGWYAKRTGLPVGRLICASNSNKVLYDFFSTRTYDKNRPFYKTASPSMDILISSNLERFLYHKCGDAGQIRRLMGSLSDGGKYDFDFESDSDIIGSFADEAEARAAIGKIYERGYIIDPHTAVAYAAYEKVGASGKNVIIATASPYKFADEVCAAIGADSDDAIEQLSELAEAIGNARAPKAISELKNKPVLHSRVCAVGDMAGEVEGFLL
ncbi:MAG: threonine synthase [Defluviitaleaceae bacterium]|nr:threonine synthase [Defluviitaleaceae bacterium]